MAMNLFIFLAAVFFIPCVNNFSAQEGFESKQLVDIKKTSKNIDSAGTKSPTGTVENFYNGDSIVKFYNPVGEDRRYSDVEFSIVSKDKNISCNSNKDVENVKNVDASPKKGEENIKERLCCFLKDFFFIQYFQIRLQNVDGYNYEVWVDEYKLSNNKNHLYKIPLGEHVVKIRCFGYDDIVFKANINSESEFDVCCKFKQSPFYCFNLNISPLDINSTTKRARYPEGISISFDVNRNVNDKKVTCKIKNKNGDDVFTKEFSNFTTFTQKFTFYGKDRDGNPLPNGQYSVNVIYDDKVLSGYISISDSLAPWRFIRHRFFGYSLQYENCREPILNIPRHGLRLGGNGSAFVTNRFKIAFLVPNFKFNKIDACIVLPLFRFINITFSTYVYGFREKEKLGSDMIVDANVGSTNIMNLYPQGENKKYHTRKYKMNCKIMIVEPYDWNKDISTSIAIDTQINLPGIKNIFKKSEGDEWQDNNADNSTKKKRICDYICVLFDTNYYRFFCLFGNFNILGLLHSFICEKVYHEKAASIGAALYIKQCVISLFFHWEYSDWIYSYDGRLNEKNDLSKTEGIVSPMPVKKINKKKKEYSFFPPPDNFHISATYRLEFYNVSVGFDLEFMKSFVPLFSLKIHLG